MLEKTTSNTVFNVVLFCLGLYFIAAPATALPTIITIMAMISFGYGMWQLLIYYHAQRKNEENNKQLFGGILGLVFCLLLLLFKTQLILGAMPIVFSLWMIFVGLQRVTQAMQLKSENINKWYVPLITALISFLLAIVVLTHIMQINAIITVMIGVYFVALSALSLGERLASGR